MSHFPDIRFHETFKLASKTCPSTVVIWKVPAPCSRVNMLVPWLNSRTMSLSQATCQLNLQCATATWWSSPQSKNFHARFTWKSSRCSHHMPLAASNFCLRSCLGSTCGPPICAGVLVLCSPRLVSRSICSSLSRLAASSRSCCNSCSSCAFTRSISLSSCWPISSSTGSAGSSSGSCMETSCAASGTGSLNVFLGENASGGSGRYSSLGGGGGIAGGADSKRCSEAMSLRMACRLCGWQLQQCS
mmetsp:Transcript_3722/g.9494  ORF Transcript_3722/g.9494 Transcript_3722/m.9494 type:complete len:245 (-) Transcript_3722:132-866(-)